MADFFTRLVERALGVAPVAAPDLPSMFAPTPPLEMSSEVVARRENSSWPTIETPAAAEANRTERATTNYLVKSAREIARRDGETRTPTAKGEARPRKADDPSQRIYAAEELPAAREPARPAEISSNLPADLVSAPARALDSRTRTEPRHEIMAQPSASALVPTIHGESAAPTIHVSIGRVEVRALTAPPPARTRERKAAPLRPLDQYLRDRNEGRR